MRNRKKRGAALWLTVLVALMMMTYFIGSVLNNAHSQAGLTTDRLGNQQAHYAALGAINKAFIRLEFNPNWTGSWDLQPMHQNVDIQHSLKASRGISGLGPNEVYLEAQGFTTQRGPGTVLAAVAGTAYRPSGGVRHAFFADEYLNLVNCAVDAYNASLGIGYVPIPPAAPTPTPTPTATPTPTGSPTPSTPLYSVVPGGTSVGGNTTLDLQNTTIDGRVVLPLAGTVQNQGRTQGQGATLNNSGSTFLSKRQPRDKIDLPAIRTPFSTDAVTTVIDGTSFASLPPDPNVVGGHILSPGLYSSVTVPDGGKLAFEPGEYYFEDGFFAESTGTRIQIKLTNENSVTKLFVGGEFRLSGVDFRPVESGDATASPPVPPPATIVEPAPLRVYGEGLEQIGSDQMICNVRMVDTKFTGLVVGEAVQASFQNCEIWGAVMGRSISAEDVITHYDVSLSSIQLSNHSRWKLRGLTQSQP